MAAGVRVPKRDATGVPKDDATTAALHLLDTYVEKSALVDLHVHLLGMGDASFWLEDVPRLAKDFLVNLDILEFYPVKPTHADWPEVQPSFSANFQHIQAVCGSPVATESGFREAKDCYPPPPNIERRFVLSLKNMLHAFDKKSLDELSLLLMSHDGTRKLKDDAKWYTVFDARKQQLEHRFGFLFEDLLKHYCHNEATFQMWRECFQIGCLPKEKVRTRGAFTPQFCPRRYALKDDLYSQHPIVLRWLLDHILARYEKHGVRYVELSLGVGDLIKRPWLLRHLVKDSPVIVRYLAAFVRNAKEVDVRLEVLPDRPFSDLSTLLDLAEKPADDYFAHHLTELKEVETAFSLSRTHSASTGNQTGLLLHTICIGLDYVGDELGHPFCPFNHPNFVAFLVRERTQRNGQFGFRIHCGEFDSDNMPVLHRHMAISCAAINGILKHPSWGRTTPPILRIGHGVAFRHFIRSHRLDPSYGEMARCDTIVHDCVDLLMKFEVPIEVNLTSNDYLVPIPSGTQGEILRMLLQSDRKVLLCTDNEGIWPERRFDGRYALVASEFAGAIAPSNYFGAEVSLMPEGQDNLSDQDVKILVETALNSCFQQQLSLDDILKEQTHKRLRRWIPVDLPLHDKDHLVQMVSSYVGHPLQTKDWRDRLRELYTCFHYQSVPDVTKIISTEFWSSLNQFATHLHDMGVAKVQEYWRDGERRSDFIRQLHICIFKSRSRSFTSSLNAYLEEFGGPRGLEKRPKVHFLLDSTAVATQDPVKGDWVIHSTKWLSVPDNKDLAEKWRKQDVQLTDDTFLLDTSDEPGPDPTPDLILEEFLNKPDAPEPAVMETITTALKESASKDVAFVEGPSFEVLFTSIEVLGFGAFKKESQFFIGDDGVHLISGESTAFVRDNDETGNGGLWRFRSNGFGKSTLSITAFVWCITGLLEARAGGLGKQADLTSGSRSRVSLAGQKIASDGNIENFTLTREISDGKGLSVNLFVGTIDLIKRDVEPIGTIMSYLFGLTLEDGISSSQARDFIMTSMLWNRHTDCGALDTAATGVFSSLQLLLDRHMSVWQSVHGLLQKEISSLKASTSKLDQKFKTANDTARGAEISYTQLKDTLDAFPNVSVDLSREQELLQQLESLEELSRTLDILDPTSSDEDGALFSDLEQRVTIVQRDNPENNFANLISKLREHASTIARSTAESITLAEEVATHKQCLSSATAALDKTKTAAAGGSSKCNLCLRPLSSSDWKRAKSTLTSNKKDAAVALSEKQTALRSAKSELTKAKKAYSAVKAAIEETVKSLEAKCNKTLGEIDATRKSNAILQQQIGDAEKKRSDAKNAACSASDELGRGKEQLGVLKASVELVSPTGKVCRYLTETIIAQLEQRVNFWIAHFIRAPWEVAGAGVRSTSTESLPAPSYIRVKLKVNFERERQQVDKTILWSDDSRETTMTALSDSQYMRVQLSFFLAYRDLACKRLRVRPRLLVFDECFSGVDRFGIACILDAFQRLSQDEHASVLVSSIDPLVDVQFPWRHIYLLVAHGDGIQLQ